MIDSMHQSWLPRVMAAAFPSEGPKDPCAVLQRTQPRVVTAARYGALSSLCSVQWDCQWGCPSSLLPSEMLPAGLEGLLVGLWLLFQYPIPFQHVLSPDAPAEATLLSHPDPEP